MDVDDDLYSEEEDFYAPESIEAAAKDGAADDAAAPADKDKDKPEGGDGEEEEGEDEDGVDMDDDSGDSDIDIITERKDGSKPAPPPSQTRYNDIRNIPQRTASGDVSTARPKTTPRPEEAKPAPAYPTAVPTADKAAAAASSSKLDINGNPVYKPVGKPIMQVNIDQDLVHSEKPWRKPGTDITDYFNYGFDEFTWALYASKQDNLRNEYNQDMIAANNKKMMDDFNMMMMGGMPPGMPPGMSPGMGGPAAPTGPAAGVVGVPGGGAGSGAAGVPVGVGPAMDGGMPPEMQAMFQQMVAAGMDPSQMDPAAMAGMFGGMQGPAAAQAQAQGAYGGFGQPQFGGYGRGRGGGRRW